MSSSLETQTPPKSPSINNDSSSFSQGIAQPPSFTSFATYVGPIPPPNFLDQYDKLVPGIAAKFLNEPHLEAEHRRSLEKKIIQEQINLSKRGQWMAFSLGSLCLTGAFTSIFLGSDIAGLSALILSLATFAGVFIYKIQDTKAPNESQDKNKLKDQSQLPH